MDDSHLLFAHRMMVRRAKIVLVTELRAAQIFRGAPYDAMRETVKMGDRVMLKLRGLADEIKRRGLEPLEVLR